MKALIFDFDGTVIDTETAWYDAFRDAYREHGVDLTLEQYSECIGTSLQSFNPYEYLVTHLHLSVDLDAFRKSVQLRHAAQMESETLRPGVLDLLKQAKQRDLRIGLASSSASDWVEGFLDRLGIIDFFDCIRTADHVAKVKPDPELYLQSLDYLEVESGEAIAVEDSPNGARAAVAAGIYCVLVPNPVTKRLPFGAVQRRLDSLSEVSLDDLMFDWLRNHPEYSLKGGRTS